MNECSSSSLLENLYKMCRSSKQRRLTGWLDGCWRGGFNKSSTSGAWFSPKPMVPAQSSTASSYLHAPTSLTYSRIQTSHTYILCLLYSVYILVPASLSILQNTNQSYKHLMPIFSSLLPSAYSRIQTSHTNISCLFSYPCFPQHTPVYKPVIQISHAYFLILASLSILQNTNQSYKYLMPIFLSLLPSAYSRIQTSHTNISCLY